MTELSLVRAYSEATINLLLSDAKIKPGLTFMAGGELTAPCRIGLAQSALAVDNDVVHFGFAVDPTGSTVMTGITIFAPREGVCYVHAGCRLAQRRDSLRPVLVPANSSQSYFEVTADEIIQRAVEDGDFDQDDGDEVWERLRRDVSALRSRSSGTRVFQIVEPR